MPNPKKKPTPPTQHRPAPPPWQNSPASFIAGQAHVDQADHLAAQMERKWGVDRLRLLVSADTREKFDRQRYKLNTAIWNGDLETVKTESKRMAAAWIILDREAAEMGAEPLSVDVWEVALPDGSVAILCRSHAEATAVVKDGRFAQVFTISEIANLIHSFPDIAKAKQVFPGASVIGARHISDPLDQLRTPEPDDAVPF